MFIVTIPLVYFLGVAAVCSLLGCIVPLPALAAAAALVFPRRLALGIAAFAWLLNQAVGFGFRGYPHTLSTALWGVAIGAATLLAASIASTLRDDSFKRLRVATAFLAAFAVYELVLVGASMFLGGWEAYTIPIVGLLLATNAAWFLVSVLGCAWFAGMARGRTART